MSTAPTLPRKGRVGELEERPTRSAAFSTGMLARWKRWQGFGRDQPGSVDGRLVTRDGHVVPTPEEETVFQLLGMQPVPPERRSGVVRETPLPASSVRR